MSSLGFVDAVGQGLGSVISSIGANPMALAQTVNAFRNPGGYGGVMPGGVPVYGAPPATAQGGFLQAAQLMQASPARSDPNGFGFDMPFRDVTPQGSSDLFAPFRVTSSGNQVAQPHVVVKANGRRVWMGPYGEPKGWTKVTVKKNRRCHRPR